MHGRSLWILFVLLLFPYSLYGEMRSDSHKNKSKAKTEIYQPSPDALPRKASKLEKHVASSEVYGFDLWKNYGKEGIDVSHYQGTIDWEQVRNTDKNISYVYIKATEGTSLVDDTYHQNLEGAKRVGLKVGSYHFYRPNIPIEEQLQNIKDNIKKEEQDLLPLIDVETMSGVSQETFVKDLQTFLESVTQYYGKRPLVYTFYNFYIKHMLTGFSEYKMMIARYHDDVPVLPDERKYVIWQYTSKGRIFGIRGNVDRSKIMPGFSLGDLIF